MTNSAFYNDTS